ncbi:hypothetical protein RvY_08666 [Ramazzottius varieornatus]|uniref:BHLH domain-containing protein n=1 Tax=Ramazzottius varieornatus TaxID=947166 RepID=A0A1D1V6P1_RAMVA|nr:hypothetical protein RvY_08666 [Ramazzottius varieornatus]
MAQAQLDLQAAIVGSLAEGPFSSSPTMEPSMEDSVMKDAKMEALNAPPDIQPSIQPTLPVSPATSLGKRRERGKKKPSCPAECTQHDVCPSQPTTPQKSHVVFERFRRSRLSRTVAEIAKCVPLSNPKYDKATVLEAAVVYLEYFHANVSNTEQFDAEFLLHLNNGSLDGTTVEVTNVTNCDTTPLSSVSNNPATSVSTPHLLKAEGPDDFKVPEVPTNAAAPSEKPKPKRKRPSAISTVQKTSSSVIDCEQSLPRPLRQRPAKKSKLLPANETLPVGDPPASCTTDFRGEEANLSVETAGLIVSDDIVLPRSDGYADEPSVPLLPNAPAEVPSFTEALMFTATGSTVLPVLDPLPLPV